MTENPDDRSDQNIWQQLRVGFLTAGKTLFSLRQKLSLRENASYVIDLTMRDDCAAISTIPIVSELRASPEFRSLVTFVDSRPSLRAIFLQSSHADVAEQERPSDLARLFVELILLRTVVQFEMEVSASTKDINEHLNGLIAFLKSPKVLRKVCVPLYNVCIPSNELEIEGLGKLGVAAARVNDFETGAREI